MIKQVRIHYEVGRLTNEINNEIIENGVPSNKHIFNQLKELQ